jgi:hypothetical protein
MPYTPPKYTPNTAAGQIRRRIWRVGAENPNQLESPRLPVMTFHEEDAIMLEGATVEKSLDKLSGLTLPYAPAEVVPTRSPATDALGAVGRIPADLTMAECLAVIYSLGRHAQAKRDASETAKVANKEAEEV